MILDDTGIIDYVEYMRWTLSSLLSQKVKCQTQLHQTMMEVCQVEIGNNWTSFLAAKTGKNERENVLLDHDLKNVMKT